jgi:hypothetical protein
MEPINTAHSASMLIQISFGNAGVKLNTMDCANPKPAIQNLRLAKSRRKNTGTITSNGKQKSGVNHF